MSRPDSFQQLQSTINSVRHQIAVMKAHVFAQSTRILEQQEKVIRDLECSLEGLYELENSLLSANGYADLEVVSPSAPSPTQPGFPLQDPDTTSALNQDANHSLHSESLHSESIKAAQGRTHLHLQRYPQSEHSLEYCQILEQIARGESLPSLLRSIVQLVEQWTGAICAVMLVDEGEDGSCLRLKTAPHLPGDCAWLMETVAIAPQISPSGSSAFTRESVVIEDFKHSRTSQPIRESFLRNGIQAGWSTPILTPGQSVLGTIDVYYTTPRIPTAADIQQLQQACQLAFLAIAQHQRLVRLHQDVQLFRGIFEQSSVGFLVTDLKGRIISANAAIGSLLGYTREELQERTFKELIHPAYVEVDTELFGQLISGVQSSYQLEERYLRRLGDPLWARVRVHGVTHERGSLAFTFRVVEDVTQAKRAEAELFNVNSKLEQQLAETTQQLTTVQTKLKATETHLHAILDNVPMGIVVKDLEHRYVLINQHKLRTSRLTYAEIIGKTEYDVFEPSIAAQLQANDRKVVDAGVPMQFEESVILEGRTRHCLSIKFPIRNEDGSIGGVGGVFLDITERKQVELALRESESRLQAVLENAPIAIMIKDLEDRYTFVNRQCETIKQMSRSHLLGCTEHDAYPLEIAARLIANDHAALAAGEALQFEEVIPVKGKLHTCLSIKFPLRNVEGVINSLCVMFLDITERKTMETALRNSEARLQTILDKAPLAISVKDLQDRLVLVNRHFEIVQGVSRHEIVGKTEHAFLPAQAAERIIANDRATLAAGVARKFEEDLPLPGGIRTFISVKFPLRDAEGEQHGLCSMSIDMTERKQAEDALRLSEARLRALINTIPCSIWVRDSRDRLILQNAMNVSFYGDLLGTPIDEAIIPDELSQKWIEDVEKAKQGTVVRAENVELIHGHVRHLLSITAPVPDLVGNIGTLGVSIDITEQKRVQNQLRDSQADLQHRVELEQLLTSISTDFINLKFDEIDCGIQSALARIGMFAGAERSYVFLVLKDPLEHEVLQSTHGWCMEGVDPCYCPLDPLPLSALPWSFQRLARGELLSVSHLDDLPPAALAEKETWQAHQIQSLLRVPIVLQGRFMGFVGFDSVTKTQQWSQVNINLLKLVGEIIARALERKDAEYAIRQSEEKYRQAIDNAPNPIFSVDNAGLIQTWNHACENVFLYTDAIIGQPFSMLLDYGEETYPSLQAKVISVFKGHIFPSVEIAYRTQKGQECYTISRLYPVRNRYGVVEACVFSNTDITERRRAEEALRQSEATNRALIDAIPDILIRMDQQGRILNIFRSGSTQAFKVGTTVNDILPPDKVEERMSYVREALRTGQTQSYEYELTLKGTVVEEEARITVSGAGEVLVMVRDITARKHAERSLQFRVAFEELLNQLSGEFMNLALDEVDQGIAQAIETIGSFLSLDRVYIHRLLDDQRTLKLTYYWHVNGLSPTSHDVEQLPINAYRSATQPLQTVFPISPNSLPIALGTDTFMMVPITARGELIGVIGFDAINSPRTWSPEDTSLLTTFANLLAGILTRKRTETALRQSEELFRSVFENAPVAIGLAELDYCFTKVNPQMYKLLGSSEEGPEGPDIPFPKALKPPATELQQLLTGEHTHIRTEKQWIREQNKVTWVSYTISLIRDHHNRPLYYLGMFEDVTARKQAEQALWESRQKYYTLFEAIPLGIAVTDESGYLTETNPAFRKLLGPTLEIYPEYHFQQVNGGLFFAGLPAKDLDQPPERMYETYIKNSTGELTWLSITTAPIPLPDYGTVLTYTDVTERKQLEQQKDDFIAVVSHELRTPLTSMRALFGLLSAGKLGTLSEQGVRLLRMATSDTDRLERLVNDILTLGRLRAGRLTMNKQLLPIDKIVGQVVQLMSPLAEEDHIRILASTDGGAVWADPDRLIQVLTNLVGNAVKFSPQHGCIWITASSQLTQAVWTVRDQGSGIPADKLEAIFEPFKQLDKAPHRQKTGTGLGLAICQQIIQQHGGRIWAESDDEGSTFTFILPNLQLETF